MAKKVEVLLIQANKPTSNGRVFSENVLKILAENNPKSLRYDEAKKELYCRSTAVESFLLSGVYPIK